MTGIGEKGGQSIPNALVRGCDFETENGMGIEVRGFVGAAMLNTPGYMTMLTPADVTKLREAFAAPPLVLNSVTGKTARPVNINGGQINIHRDPKQPTIKAEASEDGSEVRLTIENVHGRIASLGLRAEELGFLRDILAPNILREPKHDGRSPGWSVFDNLGDPVSIAWHDDDEVFMLTVSDGPATISSELTAPKLRQLGRLIDEALNETALPVSIPGIVESFEFGEDGPPSRADEATCATCPAFDRADMTEKGKCRANPPGANAGGYPMWPTVQEADWCLRHPHFEDGEPFHRISLDGMPIAEMGPMPPLRFASLFNDKTGEPLGTLDLRGPVGHYGEPFDPSAFTVHVTSPVDVLDSELIAMRNGGADFTIPSGSHNMALKAAVEVMSATASDIPGLWIAPGYTEMTTQQLMDAARLRRVCVK